MTGLSVNVNKIATLRNARGGTNPDLLSVVLDIVRFGANGITVHPRPDQRHIRRDDVYVIAENIDVEFNIEGFPSRDFMDLVGEIKPAQCTLVPDPPDVLTSNAGWDVIGNKSLLSEIMNELHRDGIRTSVFIDPYDLQKSELEVLRNDIGADRIELYTGAYAKAFHTEKRTYVLGDYKQAAKYACDSGLEINAGHDLDLDNLNFFITAIPETAEVSIGHAIVCDSLYLGLAETIRQYLECLVIN